MGRYLLLFAAIAFVILVYRVVALRCGRTPTLRPWFAVGGVGALCLAVLLVPWLLAKLKPPWSESPSGILIVAGKLLVVGFLSFVGVGMLLGAARPLHRRDSDDEV
jgi:hypothetical protein